MGWLSGYSHRIKFKIDHTKIDSDLTHFPVTLFLTEENAGAVFNELGSNYKKIAVTSDDGTTQLYVEVEVWDSANKRAVLHISRSSWTISSSADTYFYLYYDASAADNTTYVGDPGDSVAANVWDSNFAGVWHLSQDPTGGSGCIKDSTSNNNDGTPRGGMTSDDLVDGQVGKALDFDGSNDYVDADYSSSLNITESITLEACVKIREFSDFSGIFCVGCWIGNSPEYSSYALQQEKNNHFRVYFNWGTGNEHPLGCNTTLQTNQWYYLVGLYDYNAKEVMQYVNGVLDSNSPSSWDGPIQSMDPSHKLYIGADPPGSIEYGNEIIDEIRISNVARSAAWIKATYYSLFNDLVTVCENLASWSYRKKITISGSPGAGTGYQVLLKVGESVGASNCDFHVEGHSARFPSGTNDSGDLRFVDDDGTTWLSFWVEKVVGEAPNRVAYCWVKINDNLDSDVDIYCYYGNANASNVSNGEGTFIYFNDSGDTTGWATVGAGTLSTSNDRLRVDSDDRGSFDCYRGDVQNVSITATVFPQYNERYALHLRQVSGNTMYGFGGDIGTTWLIGKTINGSHTTLTQTSSGPTVNATHKLEFRISGTSLEGLVDDSVLLTASDSSITDSGAFGLGCWYNSINEFDNIYVRKYISPEPFFSTAGNEEILGTWAYRKEVIISGSPGAGTGYQVLLKVGESAGASNYDFHVEGHSARFPSGTNDSGDLRFIDNDSTTFLNFWVEKVEGEAPNRVAYCWVKINDNLDSDVNIYCYYGNPEAGNVSNPKYTMFIYEDMETAPSGTLKGDAYYDPANKWVRLTRAVDYINGQLEYGSSPVPGFVAEWRHWTGGGDGADAVYMYASASSTPPHEDASVDGYIFAADEWQDELQVNFNGTQGNIADVAQGGIDNSTWHDVKIVFYEKGGTYYFQFWYDGVKKIDGSSTNAPSGDLFGWGARTGGYNNVHRITDLLVRKYISPEPSFSTAGGEEQLVGPTWHQAISYIRNRFYEIAYNSKHYLTSTFRVFLRIWRGDFTKVKNKVFADALTLIANQVRSYQLVTPHMVQHWDGPEGDYRFVPSSTRERPWWWWPYACGEPVSKGQEGINYSRISKDRRYDTFFSPQRYYWGVIVGTPYSQTPSSYAGKTIEDKPKNFFWNRVYVVPAKIDFGFTKVGSSRLIHILHRYEDTSHDLQSVSSSDPTFSVTLPEPLPYTMAPGAEMDGLVNVAQVGAVRVVDAPIYFHFDTVGDAICYVSATFAIVLLKPRKYDQWNTPHTFQKIKFKFETELVHNLASKPVRIPKLYYPVRSSSLHLGAVDEVAYDLDYDAINAARYLVVVPEFPLRVRLASNAHQHDTQIVVEDVTDFEVGYSAVLCSSRHLEAGQITEIDAASKTLKFAGQLQYDYNVDDTWVYPSFTGYGHVRRTRSLVKHNVYNLEIDVDEIIPKDCNALTGTTSQWYKRPKTVLVEGSVVDSRDVKGLEVGIPSIKNPLSSRLRDKIVVTHSYQFFGTAWRDFKDLFLYAKGRYQKVNIITWLSELQVYEDAYQGSASLKIIPRTYSEIWSAYKKVVIDYGSTIVHTTVTGVVTAEDHCVVTLQDNLSLDTPKGTPLHFKIDAYLTEDTIEFDFKGDGCSVTVTWEEAND